MLARMDRYVQRAGRSPRGRGRARSRLRRGLRRAAHLALLVLAIGLPTAASQPLTVAAASSLTDVFAELAARFEATAAGGATGAADGGDAAPVRVAFGASSTLATQILQGAPFDVFASADEAQMRRIVGADLVAGRAPIFAYNRLVLAVREGAALRSLEDLAEPGVVLVLAAPQVPAGAYADAALDRAAAEFGEAWRRAVVANVVSREPNVRQVAAKVALGEADAALVYATDVRGLAGVIAVALPDGVSPVARYPVAVLDGAVDARRAHAFVDFLLGPEAEAILVAAGFGTPER